MISFIVVKNQKWQFLQEICSLAEKYQQLAK